MKVYAVIGIPGHHKKELLDVIQHTDVAIHRSIRPWIWEDLDHQLSAHVFQGKDATCVHLAATDALQITPMYKSMLNFLTELPEEVKKASVLLHAPELTSATAEYLSR